jgi:hypothetical protein
MPGLVAALRVHDRPWSFLHIPSWLAAFTVNFAFTALGRELGPLFGALRGDSDDRVHEGPRDRSLWPDAPPYPSPARDAEPRPL